MKQTDNKKVISGFLKVGLGIIALVYVYALLKIVLLKYGFTNELGSVNMRPFAFVEMFRDGTSLDVALKNVLGNIAIFIPLGIYVALLGKKKNWISILICFGVSVGFELIQLITRCGATDIDDLILNTFGGIIGVFFYKEFLKLVDLKMKMPIVTVVFLIIFGVCGRISLYLFAPNMLPTIIVFENEDVFQGTDKESYSFGANCTEIRDGIVYLKTGSVDEYTLNENMKVETQYEFSEDAVIIMESMSYQYSPNGNIQKTIVSYKAVNEMTAQEAIENQGFGFVDLWIDDNNKCNMIVITIFEKGIK